MDTTENLASLVRNTFKNNVGSTFRPCAFFDDRLDCIRVIARDCSVTETRVNGLFTVLEANYPKKDWECVGFTIKGARHFCQSHNLSLSMPIKISDLLNAVMQTMPNAVVHQVITNIAKPLVEDANIEQVEPLDFPETAITQGV
jgi:hypothetical protein